MKKGAGYYIGKYFKSNGIVLLLELLVVALVSVICSVVLSAEPVWLGAVLALMAYLIAETRFMMAYVAKNVNHDLEEAEKQTKESTDDSFVRDAAGEEMAEEEPLSSPSSPSNEEIRLGTTLDETPEETDLLAEEEEEAGPEIPEDEGDAWSAPDQTDAGAAPAEGLDELIENETADTKGTDSPDLQNYEELLENEAPPKPEAPHSVSMDQLVDEADASASQADDGWAAEPEASSGDSTEDLKS